MRVALAQINTTVGDFSGNVEKIRVAVERADAEDVDLVVFPEQAVPGYPAEDFLERADFCAHANSALGRVVEMSRGKSLSILVGTLTETGLTTGKPLYNSATMICDGTIIGSQHKTLLPTYDVFDEARYFQTANEHRVFDVAGWKVGTAIWEDVWNDESFWSQRLYDVDPVGQLTALGANFIAILSASPFSVGRRVLRMRMLQSLVRRWRRPVVFVNLVGGNTTLVFDGHSIALDAQGELAVECKGFGEDFRIFDTEVGESVVYEASDDSAEAYDALVLGTRDYLRKTGFEKAVLGLSGGIDSSLTAAIAADAIGGKNVIGVSMPTRYSSAGSRTDAKDLARRLGIQYYELPVEDIFATTLRILEPVFRDLPADVTEENLQARARGMVLMAISNKLGALLLTTGNKSELAVGYCTLYGDMCGGLAVISDVPKTLVYRLSLYVNRKGEIIPHSVLEKPPSAELRPDQTDQDSLPPYEVLDQVLEGFVEQGFAPKAIRGEGVSGQIVDDVIGMVQRNEYKRKQAAPGIRITAKAFGPGRRFPIVHRFRL